MGPNHFIALTRRRLLSSMTTIAATAATVTWATAGQPLSRAAYLISIDPVEGYDDPAGMGRYAETVKSIVESFGGVYLVRHEATHVLEGDWDPHFIVLIRFPSAARLKDFYESQEYRPWRELRMKAGRTSIITVEG
jgi:uncharacterized protein (DUF1330 family)